MMTRKFPPVLLAALIGLAAFVFYTGGAIVWPTSTEWLMRGDFGQHFLGWNFFRNTPMLQFPLGANLAYGELLGSSIVFTDSTPLFAFLFKPFAALLPQPFQYIGIWLALTVVLQAVFAYKLLSLFSSERLTLFLATAFFVIAPPLWWRIYLEAESLSAHWLILAGLYLYFGERFRWRGWLLLLCAASLAHAYLLAMVLAIWAADLLQRWLKKQVSPWMLARLGLSTAACLGLLMWSTGYFMLRDGLSQPVGLSYYRMSLLGLIDPIAWWSTVLPDQPRGGGEFDGFSFLGVGMLALLAVVVVLSVSRPVRSNAAQRPAAAWRWTTLLPLLIVASGLTLQALSSYIGWANHDVLVYPLPAFLQKILGIFRASGRMFWPVFYMIYVGAFYAAFKLVDKRWLPYLLGALLVLQLADSNDAALNIRKSMREYRWTSPLQSAFWKQLPPAYRRIAITMPAVYSPDYFPIALFASEQRLTISHGYFARIDQNRLVTEQRKAAEAVFTGRYDPQTLYVFLGDALSLSLWEQAKLTAGPDDLVAELDGYRILAPGWKHCSECQRSNPAYAAAPPAPPADYTLGAAIDFRTGGNAGAYLTGGWSAAETWGTWTNSNAAAVWLNVPGVPGQAPAADLTLEVFGQAYVMAKHPQQTIQVSANGQALGELHYTAKNNRGKQSLRIPAGLLEKNHGRLLLLFTVAETVSPLQVMENKDMRGLGLGAISMVVR